MSCDSPAVVPTITIRAAALDDLDVVGRLCVGAYIEAGQLDDDSSHGYSRVLADAQARFRDAVLVVAARGDDVVGTVTLCPPGSPFREIAGEGEMEFRFLAVDPSAWGSGVGVALVEHCRAYARAAGADELVIGVRDTNVSAMALYERCGFTRAPARDFEPVPGVRLLGFRRPVD